jgi:hypothetical protein
LASELIASVRGSGRDVIVRANPSTSADIVTTVSFGTPLVIFTTVPDSSNPLLSWYEVHLADGTVGWMRSDLVTVIGPPTPFGTTATPTATYTPSRLAETPRPTVSWGAGTLLKVINASGAWLRSAPSTTASQTATLAFNNPITATGRRQYDSKTNQWWWEVRADWGAVGWVEQFSLTER